MPAAARVRQWLYGAFLFLVVARRTIVTCEQTYVRNMSLGAAPATRNGLDLRPRQNASSRQMRGG